MDNSTNKSNSKTFPVAAATYFGRLPGQGLAEFAAECRKLTDSDKAELRPLLAAELGCEVT
jgi:hypothetical protein